MTVDVDINTWPTKREAAAQLGVPARSIDLLLKQRRLAKRIRRAAGNPVTVIDPKSIAAYKRAFLELSPVVPAPVVALARVVEPAAAPARGAPSGLEAAFLAFLQSKTPSALVPVDRRIFLTMAESAEFSGLPAAYLRRLIASGKLKALKTGAGWRVSRVELEKLSETLTDTPEEPSEHELRDLAINRRRRQGTPLASDNVPGVG